MDDNAEPNVLGKGLHIAHLNIRSLLGGHKFEMVKHQVENSGIDVFSMSETWLNEAAPNKVIDCNGYNLVRLDRRWNEMANSGPPKKGGGVACYIKNSIKYSDTKYGNLNISCKDLEMLWVRLEIDQVRPIVVIIIYRPPQGDYKKGCTIISQALEQADLKDNTDIFLLGDFNIDYNDRNSVKTRELDFTTRSLGLTQLIDTHTRIAFRNGIASESTIDLIFSNSDHIEAARTLDYNLSDHLTIVVTRRKQKIASEKIEFTGRSYKNYIKADFQKNLSNLNWDPFFGIENPDKLWDFMENRLLEQANLMCPSKKYKVKAAREPWITNEAIEAIKDKDRLMRRAKRTRNEVDWANARQSRNRVGRDLENLRAEFLKRQQEAYTADPKKFWRIISSIIPGKKGKSGGIWLKDNASGEEIKSSDIAGHINEYFTNIGPDLAKLFDRRWQYFGTTIEDTMEDFMVNLEEIQALCKDINPLKSSGMDDLPAKLCKDAFLVLGEQLVHIYNCSLRTGIFPQKWKVAKIVPLYKGGDRKSVNNYRPVSLLPIPGKLLEKLVHKRISNFWNANEFLSSNQGGFRKGHSTTSTIADLTDNLFQHINKGNTTLAAFVDLRKAFDTVNTHILLAKLECGGIRNNVLKWCRNYLSDRVQCTLANGQKSTELPVTCGVPQGSVLGPLFFLVYVNDVEEALDNCGLKLYADDTVLFQQGVNCMEAETKLQNSLDKFKVWCDINALTINIAKTKIMAFASRSKVKKCKNVKISINGERLKLVPSFKYLGLSLDSTLNFTQQQ